MFNKNVSNLFHIVTQNIVSII